MEVLYSPTALCLLVAATLWVVCSGQVSDEVTVKVTGERVNGSDVTLTCNHTAFDSSNVSYDWEKYVDGGSPGSGMKSGSGSGSYVLVDVTQTLTFSPFVFGNESVYRCNVSVSGELFSSLPYTLYISPEGSVSVTADPDQGLYSTSDNIILTCLAQGGPSNMFQWQNNDVNLTNEILNITGSDGGGVYTCVVSNDAGTDMDSLTVNIFPEFIQPLIGYNAEVDTYRTLECNVTAFPAPTYQWYKVGGELGVNVSGENTAVLRFNPVQYGDEGDYYCQATSGSNTITSDNATLTIATRGTVTISPVNGAFAVRENATLTCSAMGGPNNMFQWYRVDMVLEGENSSVLTLTNITLDDGAKYVCVVSNLAGPFNTTTFVLIEPNIIEHPSDMAVANGTVVTFECQAEAFPDPTYEWTYSNGSAIDRDSVVGANTSTLKFVPAVFGTEGCYVCTATANNATAVSDVAVLSLSPSGTVSIAPQNTTVGIGDNLTLTCSALGGPNNAFEWEHEGESINVTTASLLISDISVSEGGDYTCKVTNDAGEGFDMVTVFIRLVITSAEDILTTNGSSIEFVCESEGIPSPNVIWQRIQDNTTSDVSSNSAYSIATVRFGDEGDYQCVATSDSGSTSETATLTISPEGSVLVLPHDVSSERNVSQTFTCSAMGGPGNSFTWTRLYDSVVVSETSSLTVLVDGADKGSEYRCAVENDAGNETEDVILRVAVSLDTHPQTSNVSINDDFSLSCTASAFPLPNITWFHNSTLVENDTRTTIAQTTTSRTVTSTITIDNAITSDGGTYVCRVDAPPGTDFNITDSDTALVLVQATPERPRNVEGVNVISRSIILQWVEPHDSNAPILGYRVMYLGFLTGTQEVLDADDTRLEITGLHPGVTYNFTVVAFNEIGDSPASAVARVRTLDEVPSGYPQNLMVLTRTSTAIEAQWSTVPIDERNGDIIFYEVELNQSMFTEELSSDLRQTNGSQLILLLSDLEEFVEYTVRVRANASAGAGPFSPHVSNQTLTDRPATPPENVSVITLSSTEIAVSWDEVPAIDRNGIITMYEVQFEPLQTFNDQISTNSVNITNTLMMYTVLMELEEYVQYNISIRAYTSAGPGPYSTGIVERTDTDEPAAAPENVSVSVLSSTEIGVSWDEVPAIDQNGVITMYEVQFEPLQTFNDKIFTNSVNITNTSMMYTVRMDLEEYVEYNISVRAYTSAGSGPYSDPLSKRTLEDEPGPPPGVLAVSLSSTSVRVNWSEVPDIDQNGIITQYEVEYSQTNFTLPTLPNPNTIRVDSDIFSVRLRDLLEFVVYTIRVRAYIQAGAGSYSEAVYVTTDEDVPASPPVNVTANSTGSTEILVTWSEVPAIDQNGVITEYEVEYNQTTFDMDVNQTRVNSTSALLTSLHEYVNYTIRVRAYTEVGAGPYSAAVTERTQQDVPASPPSNVAAISKSSTSIQVTWSEVPAIDQNGVITRYEVEYSQTTFDVDTTQTVNATTTSALLTRLHEYVNYTIRVRAYTEVGAGPYSAAVTERTQQDVPSAAPVNLVVKNSSANSLDVSWQRPSEIDINGVLTGYDIVYFITDEDGDEQPLSITVTTLAAVLENLNNYTVYNVSVYVVTIGRGPPASRVERTSGNARPNMVDKSTVVSTLLSLLVTNLTWSPPPDNNSPITTYTVTICNRNTNCMDEERSDPYLILYVLPEENYTVTITATNGVGTSDPSETVVIYGAMNNDANANLSSPLLTDQFVLLQWSPPRLSSRLNDDIIPDEGGQFNVMGYLLRINDDILNDSISGNTMEYLYEVPMNGAGGVIFRLVIEYSDSQINNRLDRETILTVTIPTAEELEIPEINKVMPEADIRTPQGFTFTWNEPGLLDDLSFLDGYRVMIVEQGAGGRQKRQAMFSENIGTDIRQYTFDQGEPHTTYSVSVDGVVDRNGVRATVPALTPTNLTTNEAPSSAPRDLTAVDVDITYVKLMWNVPASPNGIIQEYEVRVQGGRTTSDATTTETSIRIGRLLGHQNYTVTVYAINGAGNGNPAQIPITTEAGVFPPEISNVKTNLETERYSLTIRSFQEDYGPLSYYLIYVIESESSSDTMDATDSQIALALSVNDFTSPQVMGDGTSGTFRTPDGREIKFNNRELDTGTIYYFFIRLYSSADGAIFNDSSPQRPVVIIPSSVEQDIFFQLHFLEIIGSCHDFVSDNRDAKLEDITNAVLRVLTSSCADCGITSDIIDMQSFSCFPDSPSHVTYRARLQGTSEIDSVSLISLIEEWVRGGADIIVTGLLMKINSKCSVRISSFSEGECSETTDTTTESDGNTVSPGAIIGGVVAAVILIIAIMIMVVLILKYRHGNSKKAKYEVNFPLVSEKGIATTSNPAYEMTKLREENGGEYEEVGRSPEAPVSGGGVEVMYEVPSAPPSHQPLPVIPLTVTTPTGGNVAVASEEDDVYESIPGDQ